MWLKNIDDGAEGAGIKAKWIKTWNAEWEEFCQWIVLEFGSEI